MDWTRLIFIKIFVCRKTTNFEIQIFLNQLVSPRKQHFNSDNFPNREIRRIEWNILPFDNPLLSQCRTRVYITLVRISAVICVSIYGFYLKLSLFIILNNRILLIIVRIVLYIDKITLRFIGTLALHDLICELIY